MEQITKVWRLNNTVYVVIQPAVTEKELKRIQQTILEYIRLIGETAFAGEIKERSGISCIKISSSFPWSGFKKAVELGLNKALNVYSLT